MQHLGLAAALRLCVGVGRPGWCSDREHTGKDEGKSGLVHANCMCVCVCVHVCTFGERHALAGFSITQLPLIFNCFLWPGTQLYFSLSEQNGGRTPIRGEQKERWMEEEERWRERGDIYRSRNEVRKGERDSGETGKKLLTQAKFDSTLHQNLLEKPNFTLLFSPPLPSSLLPSLPLSSPPFFHHRLIPFSLVLYSGL